MEPVFTIPCPCRVVDRVCGGELYYRIRAATRGKTGQLQVSIQCGYCGLMSWHQIEIADRPVIVAVRVLPEVGK